jgi:hypothetical protein
MPCTRLLLANRSSASAGADERVRRQRRRRLTAAGTIALRQCDRRAGGAVRGRRTAEFGRTQKPPEFAGSSASRKRRRGGAYARSGQPRRRCPRSETVASCRRPGVGATRRRSLLIVVRLDSGVLLAADQRQQAGAVARAGKQCSRRRFRRDARNCSGARADAVTSRFARRCGSQPTRQPDTRSSSDSRASRWTVNPLAPMGVAAVGVEHARHILDRRIARLSGGAAAASSCGRQSGATGAAGACDLDPGMPCRKAGIGCSVVSVGSGRLWRSVRA